MVNEKMAIVTKPSQIIESIIDPIAIFVVDSQHAYVFGLTKCTFFEFIAPVQYASIRCAAMLPVCMLFSDK